LSADNHTPANELLDLIDPPAWHADAGCREHPELSWVDLGHAGPRVTAAKAVCATCLVRAECLATALADPNLVGIWGGATTRERQTLRRHTPERPRQRVQLVTTSTVAARTAV
jgi:WhiB family redox-sensing transcriptional regulator